MTRIKLDSQFTTLRVKSPSGAAPAIAFLAGRISSRAGGGQGFDGGGGGGGGGGGFSGGGGSGGLFFFGGGGSTGGTIAGVVVLLAVLLGFTFFVTRFNRFERKVGRVWEPLPPIPGAPAGAVGPVVGDAATGIAAIVVHDPAFDPEAFLAEAQRAFFVVQQAWMETKPDLSRRVMGDSLWQQHRVQIGQYTSAGRRNVLDQLAVGNADIVVATTDASSDTITVRFLASSADYDVDVASGKVVRGDKGVNIWSEDWIFQRSSGATTKQGAGTLNHRCPNCGAPLDVDLAGVCKYCRAPIMSGAYDWVLVRISQPHPHHP